MGLPNPKGEGFASPNLKGMNIVSSDSMGRPTLRVWAQPREEHMSCRGPYFL